MLSSKQLRMMLDEAKEQGQTTNLALRKQLRANEKECYDVIGGGSFDQSSANGRSIMMAKSGRGTTTIQELMEGWRRLIDVFDQALVDLSLVNNDDGSVDAAVSAQMLKYLREMTGYTNNWMYLSK